MPGPLGIDFGTSNTLVATWDAARGEGVPLFVADYSRPPTSAAEVPLVPSLIHYASDRRRWVGQQVHDRELYESPGTFRWMKRYIGRRSPTRVRVGEAEV